MVICLHLLWSDLRPKEVEEVKVVKKTDEDHMKEYHTAAKRLDNAKLVCTLVESLTCSYEVFASLFLSSSYLTFFF